MQQVTGWGVVRRWQSLGESSVRIWAQGLEAEEADYFLHSRTETDTRLSSSLLARD